MTVERTTPTQSGARMWLGWGVVAAALAVTSTAVTSTAGAEDVILFPYFDSNGENGVFLSYSVDGRTFLPLNNGAAIFRPPQWAGGQSLTRDPSITFHDGLFHMTWTSSWTGRVFGYANSPDLVNWSTPLQIQPFAANLPALDQPDNVWAPEIIYDQIRGNYQIVFASTTPREELDGDGSGDDAGNDHRLYSIRTTNFTTFTTAEKAFDQGYSVIDGHLFFDDRQTPSADDDRWIMSIKREQAAPNGKNIRFITNNPQQSGAWTTATAPVLGPGSSIRPNERVEGPSLIRFNGQWLLYADAYSSGHYSMVSSPDFSSWTDETSQLQFPVAKPIHGTVFVTAREEVGWHMGPRTDLNDDGETDLADWSIFRAMNQADLSALGPVERAAAGDLDGDGDNDFRDFRLFQADYVALHGAAAFEALVRAPEPSAAALVVIGFGSLRYLGRRKRDGSEMAG